MSFDKRKIDVLSKLDKSKQGSVDSEIVYLVNSINESSNYYTTSSCSGRIVVIFFDGSLKLGSKWLFKSHSIVNSMDFDTFSIPSQGECWFRMDGLILHVACRTLENASSLINLARSCGFKRSGIQGLNNLIVEINSSESINFLIAKDGKFLIDSSYLHLMVKEANKKMINNFEKIKKFASNF